MAAPVDDTQGLGAAPPLPLVLAAALAGVVATGLLAWLMSYLIASGEARLDDATRAHLLEYVRVEPREVVERKRRKPDRPPPPREPPPEPPVPEVADARPAVQRVALDPMSVSTDVDLSPDGFALSVEDSGEYLPMVKVAPLYPRRALRKGLEGECVVEYTVNRDGSVRDVQVVEERCTSRLFHRASVEAARKFKYQPRVIDGTAVEVPGVRNRFTYRLER